MNPTSGAGTVTGGGSYYANQAVTATATPNANYTFVNWREGATVLSTNESYNFNMPASNKTYTAYFTLKQYTITYNSPANGSLVVTNNANGNNIPSGTSVDHGTVIKIVATPNANYNIQTLTVNGSNFTSGNTHTVTAATTINCVFAENPKYSLTLNMNPASGAGTVTGGGSYYANQSVSAVASPGANYNFVNWTEGATVLSTSATYNFNMPASNKTYTANFALKQFTVTYNSPTNGSLVVTNNANGNNIPSGTLVDHGTVIKIVATPNVNYNIQTLTVNGSNFTSGNTHTVTAATTINCLFVGDSQYALTLNMNPASGAGTVTGGGSYYANQAVSAVATPNANYNFVNWTEGATVLSSNATYNFNMPASNKTYTAYFALKQFTVAPSVQFTKL
jgi:hypothetical protein